MATKGKTTKRQSIEKAIAQWSFLRDIHRNEERMAEKEEYHDLPEHRNDCWCCEYDAQFEDDCSNCPIPYWGGVDDNRCGHEMGLYRRWRSAKTPKQAYKEAGKIVELLLLNLKILELLEEGQEQV